MEQLRQQQIESRVRLFVAQLRSVRDGNREFSKEQIRELIPFLVLASRDRVTWTSEIKSIMFDFSKTIGATDQTPQEELPALIQRYYGEPGRQKLLNRLKAFLLEILSEGGELEIASGFLRMMGETTNLIKSPPEPPKEAEVRAGPFARFALSK